MTAPTIYFPENVYYKLGNIKPGRQWSTLVKTSPSGRSQRRPLWFNPKRTMQATVFPTIYQGNPFGVGPLVPITDEKLWGSQIVPFLDSIKGRLNPFYIFDPKPRFWFARPVGSFDVDSGPWPLPLRGPWPGTSGVQVADIQQIILDKETVGELAVNPPDFSLSTEASSETNFNVSGAVATGTHTVAITGFVYERIPAIMTSDLDSFDFDWQAAEPPSELTFDLEEWFD